MRILFGAAVLFLLAMTACKQQQLSGTSEQDYPAMVKEALEKEGLIKKKSSRPKLVVGIVIDQFRPDYLSRFSEQFSEGGFNRLMREGFYNKNTHYNYVPTYTGPGHASVYTGTTPAIHGIVGNSWYNRVMEESEYCAEDTSVSAVGSNSTYGNISPENLLTTTITDELELVTGREAKVVGVAIKDRGAAFPAGHLADGAYWFDKKYGKFITSTFYKTELPAWVEAFNDRRLPQQYMDSTWSTSLPLSEYEGPDDSPYEEVFRGKEKATFPYDLSVLAGQNGNYNFFTYTPFANSVVTELAKAAIEGEQMGADAVTDLLALSYSSTDILGHSFGPRSVEVQDMYLRLDRDIEDLLNYLDETVGKGEYLIFMTADHAAAEVSQSLIDQKVPAGYFDENALAVQAEAFLQEMYGVEGLMEYATNLQFYLNHDLIYASKLDLQDVQEALADYLRRHAGVAKVFTAAQIQTEGYTEGIAQKLQKGYYFKRSGDVLMVLDPAWIDYGGYGTTHGSGYNYDSHVPLIWYGWGVEEGVSYQRQHITDIAPTLSFMLDISLPNGATGEPILELLKD